MVAGSKALLWDDDPRLRVALKYRDEGNRLESEFMRASLKRRARVRNVRIGTAATVVIGTLIAIGWVQNTRLAQQEQEAQTALAEREAQLSAQRAETARNERDGLYLGLLERGNFFQIEDVLDNQSQAGVLEPTDPQFWWTLVDDEGAPFVIARPFGEGRVMAIGHESLLVYVDESDESFFLDIALQWLVGSEKTQIAFSTDHEEALFLYHADELANQVDRLSASGRYDFEYIADLASPGAPENVGMIIVGNAWERISDAEIAAVADFVENGGGLLAAGLGWSWIQVGWPYYLQKHPAESPANPRDAEIALEHYPMNRLMAPFEMRWVDGSNDFERR